MSMQQYILKRNHINAELNNIFHFPLTIAVAAMGYGKTTTARDFLDSSNARYVWLSVEGNESYPQHLWDSLSRQLSKVRPELGKQLRALGFPTDAAQREKIINIIEDHSFMRQTVLVIDDYHFVHSPELNKLLERIVRANVNGFYILILSRTIPEINIDELILKKYCYRIKSFLFDLNEDEIKRYFRIYGYNITDDIARQIYNISEGWVSAVYLIMQRYAKIGKIEPGRSIERLIETAVMSRYTDKEAKILKSLCVLGSFTPKQAVYVTDDIETDRIIQRLSYSNSFIRYDEKEDVYRIHNIFNNYLLKLIDHKLTDINMDELFKRSGQWCIHNDDIISGLEYLLKGKKYDLIMEEFEKSSINLVIDNNSKYITELFKQIPNKVKYRYPIGFLAYVGFYITNVDQEKGAYLLKEIEDYYKDANNISSQMKKRIFGEIELIRAYIHFNDAALMHKKLVKAHQMTGGRSFIANKDKIITFGSPHALYLYYSETGKLLWTMERVKEMFPYYMEMAGGCGKGFDNLLTAEYCLETGELEKAQLNAYKSIYKANTMEQTAVIICSTLVLARISAAKGEFDKAQDVMDDLNVKVESCNSPILSSAYDLSVGYIAGIAERNNGFAKWLKLGDIKQSEVLYQGMGFNYIVQGKYLLISKDFIRLEVLCEEMRQIFSQFNNQIGYLHTYILDSVAKYNLYGMENARCSMLAALDIGRADNIILPFAEYSIYIKEIIQQLKDTVKRDNYLNKIIVYANQYYENVKNKTGKLKLTKPTLTKREREILGLVIEGNTNKEISQILYIAEVTVRKNITSIYRKLDVNGRASAVKKAMELKITF